MVDSGGSGPPRFFGDTSSALSQQFTTIFRNLKNTPESRQRRVEEFLCALHDILVVHSREVNEHGLMPFIFSLVEETFQVSVSRGIEAIRVVFDVQLGDSHDERCRCFNVLLDQASKSKCQSDCEAILRELGEVLQENVRCASDLLAKHLPRKIGMMHTGTPEEMAVVCQVLATMVGTGAAVVKRSPALLDMLSSACSPLKLFQEIIESVNAWHRHALVCLLTSVAESSCIEISTTLAVQMSEMLSARLSFDTEEEHLVGLLKVIEAVSSSPALQAVPWSLELIFSFLKRNWSQYSEQVQVAVARSTGMVMPLLSKDERLYDLLLTCFLSYISGTIEAVAISALSTFNTVLASLNIKGREFQCVLAVKGFIVVSSFSSTAFDVLWYLRKEFGEDCVSEVYKLVKEEAVCKDVKKFHSLLRFVGNSVPWNLELFSGCKIDLSVDGDVNVLVRSLSLLSTLRQTEQLELIKPLVFHEHLAVRRAAVCAIIALCEAIIADGNPCCDDTDEAPHLDCRVRNAVEKLLDVAVADKDASLRCYVLGNLPSSFDIYLTLPDHLDALLMSRNDVSRLARDQSMMLLYRLHACRPDLVHEPLLLLQEYMLREISAKDGTISSAIYQAFLLQRAAEHDTLLLQPIVVETAVLGRLEVQPFVSKNLSIGLLNLLKATLDHTGPKNHCSVKQLISSVLHIVSGGTSSKLRRAAIEALCSILTTLTITEQAIYANVYRTLARIIRYEAEEEEAVNFAAMKGLSVIGAVDPAKARYIVRALQESEIEEVEEVVTPALAHYKPRMRVHPHMNERYSSIVLYLLVKTLQQCADVEQQKAAIITISSMIHVVPGKQRAVLLTQFLLQLQAWLADPEKPHLYEVILVLMKELASLLLPFKEIIPANVGSELLRSVRLFCQLPQASQKPLNAAVVELLDVVARGLPAQEMRDHRWAVEFIHQRLSQDKRDLALVLHAVKSLDSFLAVLHEKDFQIVLHHILECIEPVGSGASPSRTRMLEISAACFKFLNQIIGRQPSLVKDFCSEIVHTITQYIEESDSQEEMEIGFRTLAFLVEVVKRPAKRFIQPIRRLARQNGFDDTMFDDLMQRAAEGLLMACAPLNLQGDLNPELPLTLVSHLPSLSKEDFENEMKKVLCLGGDDFEVMGVTHPGEQTVIHFRFVPTEDMAFNFRSFTNKAQETHSTFRRNLGILSLGQKTASYGEIDDALLQNIAKIPEANKKKREQSWIAWLHHTSVAMLKNSSILPLRCAASLAGDNIDLSRDLFPFAAAAFVAQLELAQQAVIMNTLTRALEMSPNDIKQVIFGFAEFLESERGKKHVHSEPRIERFTCVVERVHPNSKFGINYDKQCNDIVVAKLEPGGPGALASVPVGARLISINGQRLKSVNEITRVIQGCNKIELTLERNLNQENGAEPRPLMDINVLARVALSSQMHAKAIFFNEILFDQLLSELGDQVSDRQDVAVRRALEVAERLIEFYNHLGFTMVAKGLVKKLSAKFSDNIIAPEQFGFDEVGALEQLNWWAEALGHYKSRMVTADGFLDFSAFSGALRCYDALGETITMQDLIENNWNLLLFRQGRFDELLSYADEYRKSLFDTFYESFTESYNRSYDTLVELQHVRHFEELVSFVKSGTERRQMFKDLWHRRVTVMSSRPAHVKTLITINSLVLSSQEDLESQVFCVRTLSRCQWTSLANHTLGLLLPPNATSTSLCQLDPGVIHVLMQHRYATRCKRETYMSLSDILAHVQVTPASKRADAWGSCWLLLGEWTVHLFPERSNDAVEKLKVATELSPENRAAFHSLGILHYDLSLDSNLPQEIQTKHHTDSITALFRSVSLSKWRSNGVMEDMLRILSIWFSHSANKEVNEAIKENINCVPIHVWLNVIPQLVARIGIAAKLARSILTDLLVSIGSKYPHALIYPLTVTVKSPEAIRRLVAERVLKGIRVSNDLMVEEASLISNEMVRIAILWTDKWYNQIHRAAGIRDRMHDIFQILRPLYDEMEHPTTPNEHRFVKTYSKTLLRARVALENNDLETVWCLLKQVYIQLKNAMSERRLQMEELSPTLAGIEKSVVAVPGTFVLGLPLIRIQKFDRRVCVMPSKQRPRRFGVDASDGCQYRFLLKGNEDLRQDERVMQFIGLINTIFSSDSSASAIGLTIPQYAVIPLTDNVGIIGWVENTETIYKMLERRRSDHDISIYKEVRMIIKEGKLSGIEEYHNKPKQERKRLLSFVMENTPDNELKQIIWDKNDTCEQWLQYRVTYGHTLAIMSMVGYVLGLGDRHLNNLMLQDKGSVVHIDFGDCFDVAMSRSVHAEAVPFRLTRLLVSALGISGVDGVYRLTSELVMKNLRRHSENLLSILEAFIYDPLINWRLTTVADGDVTTPRLEEPEHPSGANHDTNGEETGDKPQMLLSCSVLKVREQIPSTVADQQNEEETRNLQGNVALNRVRAKLTGEDFAIGNNHVMQGSKRDQSEGPRNDSFWCSHFFGESPRDSFSLGGRALVSYFPLRAASYGDNCRDVPQQVDHLIQEATCLDNLVEAYITGWAPFW
uniref:non-specific serine/threonine protein kinase n=1 Tax=Trypanosoma vivax (strain Y486) TaxID=1055687 RepID=G0TTV4_TRYVY|nr:conserved hypothetical protein, fragment [Trypanosoma vivax Y486]